MSLQYTKGHTCIYQMQQILQQVQNFAGRKTCENRHAIPHVPDKKTCTPYHNYSTQRNVLSNQNRSLHGSLPHKWTPCGKCFKTDRALKFAGKCLQRTAKIHLLYVWRMLWELLWELLRHMVDRGMWKKWYWSLYSEIRIVSTKKMTLKCKLKNGGERQQQMIYCKLYHHELMRLVRTLDFRQAKCAPHFSLCNLEYS